MCDIHRGSLLGRRLQNKTEKISTSGFCTDWFILSSMPLSWLPILALSFQNAFMTVHYSRALWGRSEWYLRQWTVGLRWHFRTRAMSGMWKAYDCLDDERYTHLPELHSKLSGDMYSHGKVKDVYRPLIFDGLMMVFISKSDLALLPSTSLILHFSFSQRDYNFAKYKCFFTDFERNLLFS